MTVMQSFDEIKLIDFTFGINLKKYDDTILSQYLAPEAQKGNVKKEGDIYSLGVLMYVLLTG